MKQIFLLTTCALVFWNCSSSGEKKVSRVEQCKAIFSDADELMKEQSYFSAREPLLEVQNTCSGTGFMEKSQWLLAQSYFLSEEWMEARAEYSLFLEQYPSSPHSPLSSYKKAVSAYNVEYVPGRDNSFTQKAIRDFDAFLSNFPENVKIDSAKIFKKELLERLADQQLAIAVLYSRMSEPQASAIYLKEMLATYPNSRKTFDALVLLCEMYIRLDQFEQAQEFITQLQNRANLFITVGRIVLVYLVCYIGFTITREGGIGKIDFLVIGLFLLNGLLTLFAQPLIYLFERLFKLVSDVSLLEFSDTNSKLLKELSDRAPGTFHHSLQVANLAETAANEIGANTLLVRVGALYHDIGKMNAPTYFSENQTGSVSPHEEMPPDQSAKIIINHVAEGIELAKKFKLPDRIIDFIRTHHGNSWVYFFLKKAQDYGEDVDEKYFRYPGPRPFSKETAILMMADAVEAASKSLREPTVDKIHQFVQSIVNKQIDEKQFNDCNITLSEIETVKKVLSKKLINIYHLRVEYPE